MSHEFWRQIFANAFFINLFRSSSSQMFFKTGVLKNLQFYLKKGSTTGVFLWTLRSVWEHLFSQNISGSWFCLFWNKSKNGKIYSHEHIHKKNTSDGVLFSTVAALRAHNFTKKRLLIRCFCEICEVLQNLIFTEDSWATGSDFL